MGKLLGIFRIAQVALTKSCVLWPKFLLQRVPALDIAAVQNHLRSLGHKTPRDPFTNTRGATGTEDDLVF